MSKTIKLTEAQLRDIVTKAVNEQRNSPNASQAAKQVWTKLSEASRGNKDALTQAISMIKSVDLYIEVVNMMRGPSSIGSYKSIIQLLQGTLGPYDVEIFNNIKAMLKKITVVIDGKIEKNARVGRMILDPASIRQYTGGSTTNPPKPTPTPPVTADPNKPTYRICKAGAFPLMYGCKQTEVGYVQRCLGLGVDYSFGPDTLKALVGYAPMSKGSTPEGLKKQYATIGLSKQEFDLIRTKYCKAKPKKVQDKKKVEAPVVDTRKPMADVQRLGSKDLKMVPSNLGINSEEIRARLIKQLQASAPPQISQERKDYIINNINDRGFDQKYVGDNLNPVEQNWVDGYMKQKYGSVVDKNKTRGGDTQIRRFDTPQG
jgi:hypothetical protein